MNAQSFLQASWVISSPEVSFEVDAQGLCIANNGDTDGLLRCVLPDGGAAGFILVTFEGASLAGNAGILYQVDENNRVLGEASLGSETLVELPASQEHALLIKVFSHSSLRVSAINTAPCSYENPVEEFCKRSLKSAVVFVVPTYPTQENRYLCAFVHSRVKAYLAAKVKCEVICAHDYNSCCSYEFEGVHVLRLPLDKLQTALSLHRYRVLISHFFDLRYAAVFDACNLDRSTLIIKTHCPETRYWDYPEFATPYFEEKRALTEAQVQEFEARDAVIKRYNEMQNVVWFFPSEKLKERSEALIDIRFNRYLLIPDVVDEKLFAYHPKSPELRRNIFFNRKFDNIATYANDIAAATILELSKRPCFKDMEFNIYGTGGFYRELTDPISHFENVHLHPYFLARKDLPKIHAQNGIGLFATRFDTQGVSMGEAAMSGLAVVSSAIDAAEYFLPNDCGLLADVENPVAYADIIEGLYNDPDRFELCARLCHEKMYRLCRTQVTVEKEIAYVKSNPIKRAIWNLGNLMHPAKS